MEVSEDFAVFKERFPDEDSCRKYLAELRWPEGFRCPKCGNGQAWQVNGKLYECKQCGRQTSLTAGTMFQDSRKPLGTMFNAFWIVSGWRINAKVLKEVLNFKSYQTAWTWLHKIRQTMTAPEPPNAENGANPGEGDILSGTVIVDETLLGTAGKETKPALAVIALEQNGETALNRVRIKVIKDGGKNTLKAFINESIAKGSKIITDGWPGYRGLEAEGYIHEVDTRNRPNLETAMFYPVYSIVSDIRQWLSSRYQGAVSPKYLQNYLDEYAFTHNHQKTWEEARAARFEQMLKNALRIEPVTYKKLTKPDE
ncbi:MAG: IS1595 family transposase [Treponema sp.]|jgi:predicted RNA-binding Zn-ribbon protein involved in translation (DUF1610 family)|nr:IS1595 family transposase [Treponema sp.]